MNVSNQIIEVIDALCDKFGIAIDWTAENVLPYVEVLGEKIIKYEIWTSVFWMVGSLLTTVLLWLFFKISYKAVEKYELEDVTFVLKVLASIMSFVTTLVIGCQTHDIITATTFPELTIYNVISNLLQ